MLYLTLTENLKLRLSPGLVASYDIQPVSWWFKVEFGLEYST